MLPPPTHNNILFELDFDIKFPLLRLLQFQIDLKVLFSRIYPFRFFLGYKKM